MTAFRVERLQRNKLHSFTVRDILGLVVLDYEVSGKRAAGTIHFSMRHLIEFFGETRMAKDVKDEDLLDYVQIRRSGERKAAAASVKKELALLKRGYSLAVKLRRSLTPNDVPFFPTIRKDQLVVRRTFLTTEQVFKVMGYLEADVADVVHFLYASAWRTSEALGLRWENVNEDHIFLETSKSGEPRRIPILGEIAGIIANRARRRTPHCDYVFQRRGKPIRYFRKQWDGACEQALGEHRIPHDLRRSAIKRMVEAGADQTTIMAWSGHKTDTVFRRYMIVDDRGMREVVEKVNRMELERSRREGKRPPSGAQVLRPIKWSKGQ